MAQKFDYELSVNAKTFGRLSRLFKKYGLPFERRKVNENTYMFMYMVKPVCESEHFDTILRKYMNIFYL